MAAAAPTKEARDSPLALLLGLVLVVTGGSCAVLLASSAGGVVLAGLGLVLLGAAALFLWGGRPGSSGLPR